MSSVHLALVPGSQIGRDLAVGGVRVADCALALYEFCDLVIEGAGQQLTLPARVVYADGQGGAGLELIDFDATRKAALTALIAAVEAASARGSNAAMEAVRRPDLALGSDTRMRPLGSRSDGHAESGVQQPRTRSSNDLRPDDPPDNVLISPDDIQIARTRTPTGTRTPDDIQIARTRTPTGTQRPDDIQIARTRTPMGTRTPDDIQIARTPTGTRTPDDIQIARTPTGTRTPDDIQIARTPTGTRTPDDIQIARTPTGTRTPDDIQIARTRTPTGTRTPDDIQIARTRTPDDIQIARPSGNPASDVRTPDDIQIRTPDEWTERLDKLELDELEDAPLDLGPLDEPIDLQLPPAQDEPDTTREPDEPDEDDDAPDTRSMRERLRGLTLAEQIKRAHAGDATERTMLERMYGKSVWEALLRNPRLTAPEVARIARMGTLPRTLLEVVVTNNGWMQIPEVRRALLSNPRLGTDQILRVLKLMPKHELKVASTQTAYPHAVRDAAKRMIKTP